MVVLHSRWERYPEGCFVDPDGPSSNLPDFRSKFCQPVPGFLAPCSTPEWIRKVITAGGIDTRAQPRSLVAVSRLRNKLVASCLLAFWLLATQHCGLESVGLFAAHDEQGAAAGCCASSDGCASDGCATVEDGAYRLDRGSSEIASPPLSASFWSVAWSSDVPPLELQPDVALRSWLERPHDWRRTWQFVQRAALSPRAPSLA